METTLSASELIRLAIDGEQLSYALYSRASVVTSCKEVKRIFNRIAQDELTHLFALLSRFGRLYPELRAQVHIIMPAPEAAQVNRLARIKESTEALMCSIQEERKSLQLYLQLMQFVEDERAGLVLETIIRDEMNHIKAIESLGKRKVPQKPTRDKRLH